MNINIDDPIMYNNVTDVVRKKIRALFVVIASVRLRGWTRISMGTIELVVYRLLLKLVFVFFSSFGMRDAFGHRFTYMISIDFKHSLKHRTNQDENQTRKSVCTGCR